MTEDQKIDHHPPISAELQTRVQQIRDYCDVGMKLFWQRQLTFAAAITLSAYYYQVWMSIVTLVLITASEAYDYILFRQVSAWRGRSERVMRLFMMRIYIGTVLSASVIAFYAISIALEQGPTTHFMSLFFLFSAALFAAMNNHQLLPVLTLRLVIYGATFLFIPVFDILRTGAPLESELWMQFFTVLFVVYFIVDCSRVFFKLYRDNLRQFQELKVEHEKTKVAYIAKTEFIATISHELRTPLTSIRGSLDLACAGALGELPPKAEAMLLLAQRNSKRLTSIVNEILDLQKFEAGKVIVQMEKLDLNELVIEAVDMNRAYATSLGVTIRTSHVDQGVTVETDHQRLQQVMSNLLSNAAKFSDKGTEIVVFTELHDEFARVFVSDQGIGLSENDRTKVFEEFSQVDSTDQRLVGGSGLGMNISKRIMEALGGVIDYTKNRGAGTTFHIDIPLYESKEEAAKKPIPTEKPIRLLPLRSQSAT